MFKVYSLNYQLLNCFLDYNRNISKNSGLALMVQQFYAMLVRRMIHTMRNKVVTVVQLLLPVLFTIAALGTEKAINVTIDEPALLLDSHPFTGFVVPYSDGLIPNVDNTALANAYISQFTDTDRVNRKTFPDIDSYVLNKKKDIGSSTFNARYIVGGNFEYLNTTGSAATTDVTANFNDQAIHGIAISLHYLMNGMLRYFTNGSYNIHTINYPLPRKLKDNSDKLFNNAILPGFVISSSILFGMAFMVTSFIIFLIKERSVGAKHLQVVSGIGPGAFWLSTFTWDMINYIIPIFGTMIVFAAFQTEAYVNDHRLGIVFFIFLVYGWAVLPFVYLLHYMFKVPATGMVVGSVINLGVGKYKISNSYTMSCPPVRGDNPQTLASELSYVQVDKHSIIILYHPNHCRPCTS